MPVSFFVNWNVAAIFFGQLQKKHRQPFCQGSNFFFFCNGVLSSQIKSLFAKDHLLLLQPDRRGCTQEAPEGWLNFIRKKKKTSESALLAVLPQFRTPSLSQNWETSHGAAAVLGWWIEWLKYLFLVWFVTVALIYCLLCKPQICLLFAITWSKKKKSFIWIFKSFFLFALAFVAMKSFYEACRESWVEIASQQDTWWARWCKPKER